MFEFCRVVPIVASLALLAACATTLSSEERESLARELRERGALDQEVRSVDYGALAGEARAAAFAKWKRVDADNTKWLRGVVARHGWPGRSLVGEEAAAAAFLLIQHADADPEFQAECLPMLESAAADGEVEPRHLAYLTDRVRVARGMPQLYGTQYAPVTNEDGFAVADEDGRLTYLPPLVEDPDQLDARRRSVGLGPWADYERRMAASQGRAVFASPRRAGS